MAVARQAAQFWALSRRRIQHSPVQRRDFSLLRWMRHRFQLNQLKKQWDFDKDEFLDGAKYAFTSLQEAIMARDTKQLDQLKPGLAPIVFKTIKSKIDSNTIDYSFTGVGQIKLLDMLGRIIHEDEETSQATVAMIVQLVQDPSMEADRHMVAVFESPLVKLRHGPYAVEPYPEPSWQLVALSHPHATIDDYDIDITYTDE